MPIMRFLKKIEVRTWTPGPSLRAILTLCIFILMGMGLFALFVPPIIEQATNLSQVDYQKVGKRVDNMFNGVSGYLERFDIVETTEGESAIENIVTRAAEYLEVSKIFSGITNIFGLASNVLITLFSVFFIAFFFLKDDALFKEIIEAIIPDKYLERVMRSISYSIHMVSNYFSGVFLQITWVTIFVSAVLWAFGIENALLIGFFAALVNVIPYVGPIIGAIFGLLLTVTGNLDANFQQEILPDMIVVAGTFIAMQVLDNSLMQPLIFSKSVKAHPLEIFAVVLIGGQLGGILGMIIAIPLYTVLRVFASVFFREYKIVRELTRKMES